jgi:hypothetical protein
MEIKDIKLTPNVIYTVTSKFSDKYLFNFAYWMYCKSQFENAMQLLLSIREGFDILNLIKQIGGVYRLLSDKSLLDPEQLER